MADLFHTPLSERSSLTPVQEKELIEWWRENNSGHFDTTLYDKVREFKKDPLRSKIYYLQVKLKKQNHGKAEPRN